MFKLAPNRKRVHTAVDSSGDDEPSAKVEFSIKDKEGRLIAVKQALPDCDTMVNFANCFWHLYGRKCDNFLLSLHSSYAKTYSHAITGM